MFDIGWSEFVVIGVVALIVIGPKELPAVLRAVGQWTTKIRRMAGEFQSQFQEAMREAEMADLKKSVDELSDAARGVTADPFDFTESTKWQPKTDTTTGDAASETAPAGAAPPAATEAPAATETPPTTDAPAAAASAASPPEADPKPGPPAAEPIAEGGGRA
jgi:sec-independent protein translocase protein TatB